VSWVIAGGCRGGRWFRSGESVAGSAVAAFARRNCQVAGAAVGDRDVSRVDGCGRLRRDRAGVGDRDVSRVDGRGRLRPTLINN